MPTHKRRQILDAVKTAVTGLPTTGPRVFEDRTTPLSSPTTALPAIVVEPLSPETSEPGSQGDELSGHRLDRTLRIGISAVARDRATVDQIAGEVESALGAGAGIGAARSFEYDRTAFDDQGEGEKKLFAARLEYVAIYETAATSPY